MAKLTDAEIASSMQQLKGWRLGGDAIVKAYEFGKFMDGIRFVDKVAAAADAADHHPDIDIHYTTVTMSLSTHSAGGLTRKDFELAKTIDQLRT